MFKKNILSAFLMSIVLLVGITVFAQTPDVITDNHGISYVPGELIVKFISTGINLQKSRGMNTLSQIGEQNDFEITSTLPKENIALICIDEGENIQQKIQQLSENPSIEYVQPNYRYELLSPNDPLFYIQWSLDNTGQNVGGIVGTPGDDIQRLDAMNIWSGDANPLTTGTIVAVLDVGISYTHTDLINQMWDGTDCLSPTGQYRGGCSGGGYNAYTNEKTGGAGTHGTHVAGIIGAQTNNSIGVAGVNPGAKLMNIAIGDGNTIDSYLAISALSFAKYNGAKIVNMSRGGRTNVTDINPDQGLYNAIKYFPGLVTIAAGNRTTEHTGNYFVLPADFATSSNYWSGLDNVISVAGTDQDDHIVLWGVGAGSDYGERISIGAPACVYSTVPGNQIAYSCGTSMSAPHVAGVASLLRSFRPSLTYLEVKNILLEKAETITALQGKIRNAKRVNAFKALEYLYVKQISGVFLYDSINKEYIFSSGLYFSGSSGYLEWGLSPISGQVNKYLVNMQFSGEVITTTGTTETGLFLPFAQDGRYDISITPIASDKGLTGDTQTVSVFVDTIMPTASVVYAPVSGSRTSGNVVALLTGRNENLYTINATGYTFTGNGSYVFTFTDSAGNTGSAIATVDRIDKTLPSFTGILQSGLYTTGIYITFGDNVTGVTATLNGIPYTNTTLVTGNGSYTLIVIDSAGNTTGATFTIDNIPPTPAGIQTPGPLWNGSLSWTPATDTGAGMGSGHYLYTIYLSGSGSPILSGTVSTTGTNVSLSNNGYYTLLLSSCDAANNCILSTTGVFVVNKPATFSFTTQTSKELSTNYFSNDVTISGLITGATVIIQGGSYSINSGTTQSVTGTVYNGDKIKIYLTSSSAYSSTTTSTLNIGGLTGTFSITTKSAPVSPGGGGGGGGSSTPTCTAADLMCSLSIYVTKPGISCLGGNLGMSCVATGTVVQTGNNSGGILYQTLSGISPLFSLELNQAFIYAHSIGITTMPTIARANMTGTLIRQDLAKMMSNFVITTLKKTPNTGLNCSFEDMVSTTVEMQFYSKLACQLGLMGRGNNGRTNNEFAPEQVVTRAQFGTVLSRALWGTAYNTTEEEYYVSHLKALNKIGIMKTINNPLNIEMRGYVMLMLMRTNEKIK